MFRRDLFGVGVDGTQVYLAEGIRMVVREAGFQTPIVTAEKIREPKHAEEVLQQGKVDILGLCRALLCDPDWPAKTKEGREKEIVRPFDHLRLTPWS